MGIIWDTLKFNFLVGVQSHLRNDYCDPWCNFEPGVIFSGPPMTESPCFFTGFSGGTYKKSCKIPQSCKKNPHKILQRDR